MNYIVDNFINIKFKCDSLLFVGECSFSRVKCQNETKSSGSACKNKCVCIGKEKDVKQMGLYHKFFFFFLTYGRSVFYKNV